MTSAKTSIYNLKFLGNNEPKNLGREIMMKSEESIPMKPHAVCVPSPFQSHITAMLKLDKLLHFNGGFHITFVNTDFNHRRLLKSQGPQALDGFPGFQFRSIPDGLPPSDEDKAQDLDLLCEAIQNYMSVPFTELLQDLNYNDHHSTAPVSCVVSDGFMSFATDLAAEKLGVPIVYFWTASAFSHLGSRQFRALRERGLTPLKDINDFTNEYLNTTIDWIPGMTNIKLNDLPDFFRTTDPNDFLFNFSMKAAERFRASAAVFHSFDALEPDVLNALASIYPKVYAIGPLHLLLNQTVSNNHLKSLGHNFLKEDMKCLGWLDRQNPSSVIYVNFGSIATLNQEQILEFGVGLANSSHPFLWIIRPDVVEGDKDLLDSGFFEKTKERGMIVDWCPQEEVLRHAAVGVFLTHCGWNSVLESITAGVPMICWPKFGDQRSNCSNCCGQWGIGVEMESDVKRGGVERVVREVMEGDKGLEMKERVMELRKLAEEASGEYGSSSVNLQRLMKDVLLM